MIRPGLVSITFRQLSPEQIVALVVEAGLVGIEWGGDIHAPHGDTAAAQRVARLTADAGLEVSAYGSYYKAAAPDGPGLDAVLDSCEALGATVLRVWAGTRGSADMGDDQRAIVTDDLRRVGIAAAERGITVGLEYHANTLTDDLASTERLLRDLDHPAIKLFWQPPNGMPAPRALDELNRVKGHVTNLHVFQWSVMDDKVVRHALSGGEAAWLDYFDAFVNQGDRFASLEFVVDDSVDRFRADAATLLRWLSDER